MKRKLHPYTLLVLVFTLLSGEWTFAQIQLQTTEDDLYQKGALYVKIKDNIGFRYNRQSSDVDWSRLPAMKSVLNKYKTQKTFRSFYFSKSEKLQRTIRIHLKDDRSTKSVMDELSRLPEVEYVERIPNHQTFFTPNDGSISLQDDVFDVIDAYEAWNVARGDTNIVVAIVDNAIDIDHRDLKNVVVQGIDLAENDNDPRPDTIAMDHGTHVAGIAGAQTNNGTGIASIGFGIRLMPVKTSYDGRLTSISFGYEGIEWAITNGADVVNCSWGGNYLGETDEVILESAVESGVIIVAAAGNFGSECEVYPAAYEGVFSVGNTRTNDAIYVSTCTGRSIYPCAASFFDNDKCASYCTAEQHGSIYNCGSTYGDWVDVMAPGTDIHSTVPGPPNIAIYGEKTGSSMAAPLVSGLCGLILSVNPNLSKEEVLQCITNTADNIDHKNLSQYNDKLGAGRINAHRAVVCAKGTVCPEDLVIVSPDYGPGNIADLEVNRNITAVNSILSGAEVVYDADRCVRLMHGFCAQNGSTFCAIIDGCGGLRRDGITVDEADEVKEEVELPAKTNYEHIFPTVEDREPKLTNYPNPFEANTIISITLMEKSAVSLKVYDLLGNEVAVLLDNQRLNKGLCEIPLDNSNLTSGVYFCTLKANGIIKTHKLLVK